MSIKDDGRHRPDKTFYRWLEIAGCCPDMIQYPEDRGNELRVMECYDREGIPLVWKLFIGDHCWTFTDQAEAMRLYQRMFRAQPHQHGE